MLVKYHLVTGKPGNVVSDRLSNDMNVNIQILRLIHPAISNNAMERSDITLVTDELLVH